MKNTKSEMIEKYNELLQRIKLEDKINIDVKRQAENKERKKIMESADELVQMNILNEKILSKYTDLNKAIEIQNEKLKELFDIEAEAFSLVALINSHNEKEQDLLKDYEEKLEALKEELKDKKEEQAKEIAKLSKEKDEYIIELNRKEAELKSELEKSRKRDEEEYRYTFERVKKEDNDKFNDKKTEREKEISEKEEELAKRIKEIDEKQKEYSDLKEKVDEIPKLIEEAEKKGAADKEKSLGKEYGYQKAMYQKEKEFEFKSLNEKINMLVENNEKLIAEKLELTTKLDAAYNELKVLATEAVKSTGGVKILNSNNDNLKK